MVDDADFQWLNEFKWFAINCRGTYYARCKHKGRSIGMHRMILGVTDPKILVDHKNGSTLDNQRHNLRPCTIQENCRNKGLRSTNKSGYKGCYRSKDVHGWISQIHVEGRNLFLGVFDTPEEAARAYDLAAVEHYGQFARLNNVQTLQPPIRNVARSTNKIGFRGVTKSPKGSRKPYRAYITFKKQLIFLGTFDTPEEAARVRDKKAIELYGDKAILNNL